MTRALMIADCLEDYNKRFNVPSYDAVESFAYPEQEKPDIKAEIGLTRRKKDDQVFTVIPDLPRNKDLVEAFLK